MDEHISGSEQEVVEDAERRNTPTISPLPITHSQPHTQQHIAESQSCHVSRNEGAKAEQRSDVRSVHSGVAS